MVQNSEIKQSPSVGSTQLLGVNIDELRNAVDELIKLYHKIYPPGTLTKDGRFIMGNDGLWYGRCIIRPLSA